MAVYPDQPMEFIATYHLEGIVIGLGTFLIIGVFHPIVIKAEYWFGTRCWWVFLLLGLGCIVASLFCREVMWAALTGVLGFTSLWTIKELFEQSGRVARGWFPANPKRTGDPRRKDRR